MLRIRTKLVLCLAVTGLGVGGCAGTGSSPASPPQACTFSDTEIREIQERAERGNVDATYELVDMYSGGQCVEQDQQMVVNLLTGLAEQGDAVSQRRLSYMYQFGRNMEKDPAKSRYWTMKSAEQGDKHAQYDLARLYKRGDGVEQDLDQAAIWFKRASDQGHQPAAAELGRLACDADMSGCREKTVQERLAMIAHEEPSIADMAMTEGELDNGSGKENPAAPDFLTIGSDEKVALAQKEYGSIAIRVSPPTRAMENQKPPVGQALSAPLVGAANGTLGGALVATCLGYCATAPGAVVGSAVGLIVGTLDGLTYMVSNLRGRGATERLAKAYQETDVARGMHAHMVKLGNQVLENDIRDGNSLPGRTTAPVPGLRVNDADTILEVVDLRAGLNVDSNYNDDNMPDKGTFEVSATARLIRSDDRTVLGEWKLAHRQSEVEVTKWAKRDGEQFHVALNDAYADLADQAYEKLLGIYSLAALLPEEPEEPVAGIVKDTNDTRTMKIGIPQSAEPGELEGVWFGEMSSSPQWPMVIRVEVTTDVDSGYTAHLTGNTSCNGADFRIVQGTQGGIRMTPSGSHNCQINGNLQSSNDTLKGKVRIRGWNQPLRFHITKQRT